MDENWNKTLSSYTKRLYGLNENATPDDAFILLRLGSGYYGYKFKVILEDGTPVQNSNISGSGLTPLEGMSGNATDSNGEILLRSTNNSLNVTATSPYKDAKNVTETHIANGMITNITLMLPYNNDVQTINSSTTIHFTSLTTRIQVTAIGGGGGGGGYGDGTAGTKQAGGGGGGGYAKTIELTAPKYKSLKCSVGSGGGRGTHSADGSNGGATSISIDDHILLSANGGNGGYSGERGGMGGDGNGRGGNVSSSGYSSTYRIFNDQSLELAGGGGGGGGSNQSFPGGSPYGGNGAYTGNAATSGKGPGGGGGGGYKSVSYGGAAGGSSGCVYFRFHKI